MAQPTHAVTDLSEYRSSQADPDREPVPPRPADDPLRPALPTGTVTFLLTDIEGSTRAWEADGVAMAAAVARHYELLDAGIAADGGVRPVEQGEGDSLVAAFTRPSDAVAAALAAQRALLAEPWPEGAELLVRMAVHTGEAATRDGTYYVGPSIIRCARLRALAHGGQVLIGNTTADLLADGLPDGAALIPLGLHRLRDLRQPERIFQLAHADLPARFPPLRSLDALPNNLPAQLTSFVGRESELGEVAVLVAQHRLVTLTGAGGVGKTRMAVAAAADAADAHPDGVWWVDLAPVADPAFVGRAVMEALALLDTRGLDPIERVAGYLKEQRALVVFDNCEHVLGSAAPFVDGLVRRCPNVTVVTTSREPLGIAGEATWRVPPLSLPTPSLPTASLPTPGGRAGPEAALRSEAVRLFAERAAEVRPTFRLDDASTGVVNEICLRLDGIPLAIELAAARVRALSPERILAGLEDRFRLLTGGSRTALPRQQTLQASVEWSHDLLSEPERTLFRRLAAFTGGFRLEAAETVAAAAPLEEWDVLPLLPDLVDKSLVIFDGDRYRLSQTVNDFARTRLVDAGEADDTRNRHAAYHLDLAGELCARFEPGPRPDVLALIEADHDNLRAALSWLLHRSDSDGALRMLNSLWFFWCSRGHYSEGQDWHRRVLAATPDDPSSTLRAQARFGLAHLSMWGMELAANWGLADMTEAQRLAGELGDVKLRGRVLADLGFAFVWIDPDNAVATFDQALAAARESGDDYALGAALWTLAMYWIFDRSRPDQAEPVWQELGALVERSGSPYWRGWHRFSVGMAAWQQGRLDVALEALEETRRCGYDLNEPKLELYGACWLSEALVAAGAYDDARAVVVSTMERQQRSIEPGEDWGELRLGLLCWAQAELSAGRAHLDAAAPMLSRYGLPLFHFERGLTAGRIALEEGDLPAARDAVGRIDEALSSWTSVWCRVQAANFRGRLARADGDLPAADDHHHEALALCVEHGFRGVAADTLEALAAVAAAGESHAEAVRLCGAAQALRDSTGQRRWLVEDAAYEADLARLRAQLGDEAFDTTWKAGTALPLDAAAAYASRARGERKRPSTGWASLTPTELEVVALAAQGLSNAEIGQRLFIAAGTAKIHLSHVYSKLGVANRAQLAAAAVARGIAPGEGGSRA